MHCNVQHHFNPTASTAQQLLLNTPTCYSMQLVHAVNSILEVLWCRPLDGSVHHAGTVAAWFCSLAIPELSKL